ncbi:hypothetical protein [Teredinibacter franksiae]|uniref:hypothetical protein n=1 Tax=Teredinibacter franksiae TaxID=2761453 RepID=UPI00162496E8|nr:hypothetical protein [Teredinibacter franksiae]
MDVKLLFVLFSCALLSVTITACGGAEGKAVNTNNTEEITLLPSAIQHQPALREKATQFYIVATVGEDIDASNLHIYADLDNSVFRSILLYATDGKSAHLELITHNNLWERSYSGTVNMHLCNDEDCNNELAGSPVSLPYNITFPPSQFRLEPIINEQDSEHRTVIDFGKDYMAIYAESEAPGTPSTTVRIEAEVSEDLGELILPQKMLEDFQVSDISGDGFTITTPSYDENFRATKSSHTFHYELGFTHSSMVMPYTIYSIEEGYSGASDQVIFLENPIELNAPFHDDFSFVAPFLFVGENSADLARIEFDLNFDETPRTGRGRTDLTTGRNYVFVQVYAPYKPAYGRYSGQIEASVDNEVIGRVDIGVNIVDGFITVGRFYVSGGTSKLERPLRFDNEYFPAEGGYISIHNTQRIEGSWQASTQAPWLVLDRDQGIFPISGGSDFSNQNDLIFSVDIEIFAALPNNVSGAGIITLSDNNGLFPDSDVEVLYEKAFPQVTSVSRVSVPAGNPFYIEIEGYNLLGASPGLRSANETSLNNELFDLVPERLTNTSMALRHAGIVEPGIYEIVFDHEANRQTNYSLPFVPRISITVTAE